MKISALELTAYEYIDAIDLEKALTAALDAMVSYTMDTDKIEVVAALLVLSKQECHRHFRKSEMERAAPAKTEA